MTAQREPRESLGGGGTAAPPLRLAVLNPWGGDAEQSFEQGPGVPAGGGHPPVNYHAYAACTRGSFHRDPVSIGQSQSAVLLLLRRDLKTAFKTLRTLQAAGKKVAVSLKEAGSHQVAALLDEPKRLALFREICATADLCLASTQELAPLYHGAGAKRALFIPTPYPVESPEWDFSVAERRGVFLGTREFAVPSRNHLAALLAARALGEPVTVFNPGGRRGRRQLEALGFPAPLLQVVEGRLPYPDYLRLVARHRLVFQLDRSAVPGQVAGDALLCRLPCVGGDGAVERLAFPSICGFGREAGELVELAARLLGDEAAHAAAVDGSQRLARERLAFSPVAAALARAFA